MKVNTLSAIIAMTTLGMTESGIVRILCLGILFCNFVVMTKQFEEKL